MLQPLAPVDARGIFRTTLAENPAWQSVTLAVDSIGRGLAGILAGKVEPAGLISGFLDGGAADALRRDAPAWRGVHLLSQLLLRSLVRRAPRAARVRILDLGRGAGGVTPLLLPVLAEFNPDYVIGRASASEVEKARVGFGGFPFTRFDAIDIRHEITGSGFKDGSFDIVISSFHLGEERDPWAVLDRLRQLLAPGGRLILAEPDAQGLWYDLLCGLFDAQRGGGQVAWEALLRERGFADVLDVSALYHDPNAKLLVAQAPVVGDVHASEDASPTAPGWLLSAEAGERWLVFCDGGGTGEELARRLGEAGCRTIRIFKGEAFRERNRDDFEFALDSRESVGRLLDAVGPNGEGPLRGIVYIAERPIPPGEPDGAASAMGEADTLLRGALVLVQELDTRCRDAWPRLWLVTRGAQGVDGYGGVAAPFNAALWGFGRVIRTEFPPSNCSLVDLEPHRNGADDKGRDAAILCSELLADGPEDEVAFRSGKRLLRRMMKQELSIVDVPPAGPRRLNERCYRLESAQPGALAGLGVREGRRRAPTPNEVEIEVRAAGLNFSDVMKALNLYPGLPPGVVPLGIECAGVISRVGNRRAGWGRATGFSRWRSRA